MKTVRIPARLPEKRDIIESWDSLTNEEIQRFVCDYEELKTIRDFFTKIVYTEKFGDILIMQKCRFGDGWTECYSRKTRAVYRISEHDGTIMSPYFEQIHFKDNRPDGIGYGLDPDTANVVVYCKKCNSTITSATDLIGREYDCCNCIK